MSRPLIVLIAVLILLVGGTILLAGSATEQPRGRVEKQVDLANLS